MKDYPCTQDCPERSPVCHSVCVDYLEYFEEKRKNDRKKQIDFQISIYIADAYRRCKSGLNIYRKNGGDKGHE